MQLLENFDDLLKRLYGNTDEIIKYQSLRYNTLFDDYYAHFSNDEIYLFSSPGRTEIGGNHTDHNLGKVIAASVNLDSIAVISKSNSNTIVFHSAGYREPFIVNLNNLDFADSEQGTTIALIRGIAARFDQLGYKIGGFDGVMRSDVLPGSGLSSSASFELLIANIFNFLFNDGKIDKEELAAIGQYSENIYFGKPCGLMDQMACSVGGIITIDFKDLNCPKVEKVNFNFDAEGYKLLIVDTGSSHVDLTDEYAAIPKEMKAVANMLGKEVCREINYKLLTDNFEIIRSNLGDRAVLRALHFFNENEIVTEQVAALRNNNLQKFIELVQESGNSSFKWLQNIFSTKNIAEQGLSVALAITEHFIKVKGDGACRVHGGGFAGTIQVFLRAQYVDEFKTYAERILGEKKVMTLNIRSEGTVCLNQLAEG